MPEFPEMFNNRFFFKVAFLVGVNLFEADRFSLTMQIEQTSDKIALLPRRIGPETRVADDDF